MKVYTVTELERLVRTHLEDTFGSVTVEGEISGFTRAASGHCYFALKDVGAVLRSVLWRASARRLRFALEEGLKVRAQGYLTIYEPRGSFQMIVDSLEPVGAGPLQLAFEQMRKKLEAEGLFDPARKVALPGCPRRVAYVTSPAGAALHDLLDVSFRRWPALEVTVFGVRVQGTGAAEEIAAAIREADGLGFDVLVVARGGGSLEDLWAFNEEVVARAIAAAKTPLVSAVGHETDISIADLVADVRAPTPSAAAELITLDRAEVAASLDAKKIRLSRGLSHRVVVLRARLDAIAASSAFRRPLDRVRGAEQALDERARRAAAALRAGLGLRRTHLGHLAGRLEALSPLRVLARGYSVTTKEGRVVTRASQVRHGDSLKTLLHEGEILSRVESTGETRGS